MSKGKARITVDLMYDTDIGLTDDELEFMLDDAVNINKEIALFYNGKKILKDICIEIKNKKIKIL